MIGEKIKKRRLELGMTQQEVADLVPCDRTYIARIENGMQDPPVKTAEIIASVLDLTLAQLIEY